MDNPPEPRGPSPWPRPDADAVLVVVSIDALDDASRAAIARARELSPDVSAVHVSAEPTEAEALRRRWEQSGFALPLTVIEAPGADGAAADALLVRYVEQRQALVPSRSLRVIVAEGAPDDQRVSRLRAALRAIAGVAVTGVSCRTPH